MTTILINIHEAKARLSEFVEAVRKGERVLICRHNRPVAELTAVEETATDPRDLTPMYPGATLTPPGFFEPLTGDELAEWGGSRPAIPARVAERRASYSAKRPVGRGRRRT
jgi:prevent-host-death family protein